MYPTLPNFAVQSTSLERYRDTIVFQVQQNKNMVHFTDLKFQKLNF